MDRLTVMEAFVRIVDTRSFSAAAAQMRIGQPAVSKSIAQLEDRLGVKLLMRNSRKLTVTEAGRDFYGRAKKVIEDTQEAEAAARGAGSCLTGRLRFSAPVTFARLHIIPKLPLFLKQHPGLDINAVLDDRPVDPIEEGIDVAFTLGRLNDSALVARRIARCDRLIFGTPDYFALAGSPLSPADLKHHQAVIYTGAGGGTAWTFRREDVSLPVVLRERLSMSAAEGVREALFAGLGLTIASEWMFRPELESGKVVAVLRDWRLTPVDLWAVFATGRHKSAKSRAFSDFVEAQMHIGRA